MRDNNKLYLRAQREGQAEDADWAAEEGWSTVLGRKDVKKLLKNESAPWRLRSP